MTKYKTEWKPMERNEAFWNEVLVGRKIAKLDYDEEGLAAFILDSGERIALSTGPAGKPTICIHD